MRRRDKARIWAESMSSAPTTDVTDKSSTAARCPQGGAGIEAEAFTRQ